MEIILSIYYGRNVNMYKHAFSYRYVTRNFNTVQLAEEMIYFRMENKKKQKKK